jgi:hypothetical protein
MAVFTGIHTTVTTGNLEGLVAPGSFTNPGTGAKYGVVDTPADFATINQLIKNDFAPSTAPVSPYPPSMGGWTRDGKLFIPNRGWIKVYPGDVVAVDALGWPILISAQSAAVAASWVIA